jgi:N-acetyl-anhydromuramyl-L-alanine amidase AmpD
MGRVLRAALVAAFAVVVLAQPLAGRAAAEAVAYPGLSWLQASTNNYDFGRRGNAISYIVIHDTEINYVSTLRAFQNPSSRRSAHYVISGDGAVTQMVPESDTAWHAGNYPYNLRSIGIEHELDRVTNPFFTETEYQASAKLVCAIASRYGIQIDRAHIFGHNEVPFATHTDPGPTWNWPHYMWLLAQCADPRSMLSSFHSAWAGQTAPGPIDVGTVATVTLTIRNTGGLPWVKGGPTEARLGIPSDDRAFSMSVSPAVWLLPARPAAQTEPIVPPGGIATFVFPVGGMRAGAYRIPLRPVIDGIRWLEDQGMYVDVIVR